jgi:arsenate reductase-like glutaredoxin family protein
MPPPSTPPPTIQVFGLDKDRSTRAAQRFFKERRVPISFVDLRKRPIAAGELRRFVERLGARALLDEGSRAYREGGLAYLRMDDAEIAERLLAEPSLLRLPLIRNGNEVSAGPFREDVDHLGQGRSRALTARTTPTTTTTAPKIAHRTSSTMKLDPRSRPRPCPIHTRPTSASKMPATIRPRMVVRWRGRRVASFVS